MRTTWRVPTIFSGLPRVNPILRYPCLGKPPPPIHSLRFCRGGTVQLENRIDNLDNLDDLCSGQRFTLGFSVPLGAICLVLDSPGILNYEQRRAWLRTHTLQALVINHIYKVYACAYAPGA